MNEYEITYIFDNELFAQIITAETEDEAIEEFIETYGDLPIVMISTYKEANNG